MMGSDFAVPLVHTYGNRCNSIELAIAVVRAMEDAGSEGVYMLGSLYHIKGFVVYTGSAAQIKEETTVEFQQIT